MSKFLFIFANITFLSATLVDADLIHFTNRRMTLSFWSLGGDWLKQVPQLFTYYWKLTLSGVFCLYVLVKTYEPWEDYHIHFKSGFIAGVLWNLAFLSLFVLGARGGLQYKPLIPGHANIYQAPILNHMVLNTTFTFLMSLKKKPLKPLQWIESDREALRKMNRQANRSIIQLPNKNIVIIVMESFALEYMGRANGGKGYTPFLDKLSQMAVYFPNFHANGRRSIEAIPSILCGLPSLLEDPFVTSQFQTNRLQCLPELLKLKGYHTSFFHGGDNGTMHFDSFSKKMGIQDYYGLNEYPHKGRDFDGSWGIFDEAFFDFMVSKLNDQKEPFMSLFFSLSSHQPYSVPEKYKDRFPKGNLEIHESVGYADYSLGRFFQNAEKQPWFQNTLFIITADHTQKSYDSKYATPRGPFQVPLLIFDPSQTLRAQLNPKISQHADITPTVLSLLGIKSSHIFGASLFSNQNAGAMVNLSGRGLVVGLDGAYKEWSFDELEQPLQLSQKSPSYEFARAYFQTYLNSLIYNKIPSSDP